MAGKSPESYFSGPAVLEHQAVVVGHLLGEDEVAAADLGAVDPELASAMASIVRSIAKQPCGRPAPR
jgi:hypothetical protein